MKKRSYLLLILFVCSVSLLHAEIITGECGENGDNVTYTWDTETGVLEISGIGNMKDWGFYAPSFFDRGIKTLRINDGVTSVGAYAFTDCTSLTNIIFPGSVTNIGERAFFGCNLLNVVKLPQNLIRIGTAGAFTDELALGDIFVALAASTDSNYQHAFDLPGQYSPSASWALLTKALAASSDTGIPFKAGNVVTCDVFYEFGDWWKKWAKMGVQAVEMETAALYTNAAYNHVNALSMITISDNFVTGAKCINQ